MEKAEDEWTSQKEREQDRASRSMREESNGHQEEEHSDYHEEQASE